MAWRSWHVVENGRLRVTTSPDRILCLVPFCRRTTRREPHQVDSPDAIWEWLCCKHWRLVDKPVRVEHRRLQRRGQDGRGVWLLCREQAITRASMEVA